MRPYERPEQAQVIVGLAAQHGLLTEPEARQFLADCLVDAHYEPWQKRTTPLFAEITDQRDRLKNRVLPANTPWALFPFCEALRQYGMEAEAKDLLQKIYAHLIDAGATTWWEEWNTNSSLCHAWGAFVADYF